MNAFYSTLRYFLAAAVLMAVFCTNDRLTGGGTIETTNGLVAGKVIYPGGAPAAKSVVKLIPNRFNPFTDTTAVLVDTSDDSGAYVFSGVSYGVYTVQSVQSVKRTRAIAFGLTVTQDPLSVTSMTLKIPGAVKVMLPGGARGESAYVYVPSSEIGSRVSVTGDSVIMDSVPAGVLPSVNFAPTTDTPSTVIRYDVQARSGDTTTIQNPSWRYARSIALNTTSSGADVAGAVFGFPALIRLTRNNFDFSQAQAGGGDIRFTKSDNSQLPYEIELWDGPAGLADVWVKVDTVHGNDSDQSITMYWGAPTSSASALSNGAAVFDTTQGFQAVLHMNQSAGGKVVDATANHYDGALIGATVIAANGPLGNAGNFTGTSGNIQLTGTAYSKLDFPQYGTYSIGAWVNVDSLFMGDQHLVGKGGLQYSLRAKGSMSSPAAMFSYEEYVMTPLKGLDRRLSPITLAAWKYIVAVRNGTNAYLYVDGLCTDSSGIFYGDNNTSNARDSSGDVTIGGLIGGGLHCNGSIDEVRIMSVPLSADFVKLCYMNQRSDDKLMIFK